MGLPERPPSFPDPGELRSWLNPYGQFFNEKINSFSIGLYLAF